MVDNDILKSKISELEDELILLNTKKNEIRNVISVLTSIKMIENNIITKNDSGFDVITIELKDPVDPQLGGTIDKKRRENIYNNCIIKADELIGST